jgi:phosphate transport system substrate-binding protein
MPGFLSRRWLVSMVVVTLAACRSPEGLSGTIKADGSSTVFPITTAAVDAFAKHHPAVRIAVAVSGTSGGFATFCRGETEIQNASRPITRAERGACEQSGVSFLEVPVAQDALTVIVHPSNSWAETLTIAELKTLWEPAAEGRVGRWADVRSGWPAEPIHLFGPGALSGTFDFFTEVVVGKVDASRRDYTGSEDDNVIVKGVADNRLALGYVGYGYFEQHKASLRAVAIAGPNADRFGAVLPSPENVRRGTYSPLARTLFIYVNLEALERADVATFVRFYVDQAEDLVRALHGIPLSPRAYDLVRHRVQQRLAGTLFADSANVENVERVLSESSPR